MEILSNTPIHIIKELINKHIKNKKELDLFSLHATKYIKAYILLCLIDDNDEPKVNKPDDYENINDLIEYQQLYDLFVIDKVYKIKETIDNKTEEIIKQIIEDNKFKKEDAKIGKILTDSVNWIRETVPKWRKKKWDYAEALIEKIKQNQIQECKNIKKLENKKGPGRPKKKNNNEDDGQRKIDTYMDIDQF